MTVLLLFKTMIVIYCFEFDLRDFNVVPEQSFDRDFNVFSVSLMVFICLYNRCFVFIGKLTVECDILVILRHSAAEATRLVCQVEGEHAVN